ncbi:MAG: hypothetical protein ABEK03_02140 [Candidatus Bipolaricaulia bacterium]
MPEPTERPTAAFMFALIAGVWILAMAVSWWSWGPSNVPGVGMMGGSWMGGRGAMGLSAGWTPWIGVAAGGAVLGGAIGLYTRPATAQTWGLIVIVAAVVNLFIGLGGFLASVLGIVGGSLAATRRPREPER